MLRNLGEFLPRDGPIAVQIQPAELQPQLVETLHHLVVAAAVVAVVSSLVADELCLDRDRLEQKVVQIWEMHFVFFK